MINLLHYLLRLVSSCDSLVIHVTLHTSKATCLHWDPQQSFSI